jgi:hypothetical protein
MSLSDMLDEEQPCMLFRQRQSDQVDGSGIPIHNPAMIRLLQGRVMRSNSHQIEVWLSLGVKADYEFLTSDRDIRESDIIQTPPDPDNNMPNGRSFQVQGTRNVWFAKGTIDGHVKYPIEEMSGLPFPN